MYKRSMQTKYCNTKHFGPVSANQVTTCLYIFLSTFNAFFTIVMKFIQLEVLYNYKFISISLRFSRVFY